MKNATMLYRLGKELKLDCGEFDTLTVDNGTEEYSEAISNGWCTHPLNCGVDMLSIPTREELEIKANDLEIKFDGRTTDKALLLKIEEALSVVD